MTFHFKNLDIANSKPWLSYHHKTHFQSKTGAIISLIFLLLAAFIFLFKIYHVYNKSQIYLSQDTQKYLPYQPLYLNNSDIKLQLLIQNKQGIRDKFIKYDQQFKYGLNVSISDYCARYINGTIKYTQTLKAAVPCENLQTAFCIPQDIKVGVLGNAQVGGVKHPQGDIYRRFSFFISLCDPKVSLQCKNLTQNIAYNFYFSSTGINPSSVDIQSIYKYRTLIRYFQTHPTFTLNSTQTLTLYFRNITFVTDQSILPDFIYALFGIQKQITVNQTWYYDEEEGKQEFQNSHGVLLQIYLKRSLYTIVYTRRFVKFDEIIGQIFGLVSLISGLIFCLYNGYNQWSFKQLWLKEKGYPFIHPSLCSYYTDTIKKCKCLPCFRQQRQSEEQTKKFMDEFDIGILGERMEILENSLKSKDDKQEENEQRLLKISYKMEQRISLNESIEEEGEKELTRNLLQEEKMSGSFEQLKDQ